MNLIIIYWIILWISQIDLLRGAADVKFTMDEEAKSGYIVGNIHDHLSLDRKDTELKIIPEKESSISYFKFDRQGNLIVTRIIDRDNLCPSSNSKTNKLNRCSIKIRVLCGETINTVEVEIKDINDNKPTWNKSELKVQFKDGCKRRTSVAITPAFDKDYGLNSQIDYTILENNVPFRIVTKKGDLYLETTLDLDHEEIPSYHLTIQAKDHGLPSLSSQIKVNVEVIDLNDNAPRFNSNSFKSATINEDSPVGTEIGRLTASDKDSGINGKFHFRLSPNVPSIVKTYFGVTRDGRIIVNSALDADRGQISFEFSVIVEDEALEPYSKSSMTSIKIDVRDVNDEVPVLNVIFKDKNSLTNQPEVSESTKVNKFVGVLEATDLDSNGQDTLHCKSENSYFSLIQQNRDHTFKVITQVELDRETKQSVPLLLSCKDREGHVGYFNKSVMIKDENDNDPKFVKPFYSVSVRENRPIGTVLSTAVKATDVDKDSIIRYSIMPEYSDKFSVDPQTGKIKTQTVFNREECDIYTIKVLATDAIENPYKTTGVPLKINTGTGTVQVNILDDNDNLPVFEQPVYTFNLPETNGITRQTSYSTVTQVNATDQDDIEPSCRVSGPRRMNRRKMSSIRYRLDKSRDSRYFRIDQRSGIITAMKTLDRESKSRYKFKVQAIDGYSIQRHSGRRNHNNRNTVETSVTIIVDDLNDNAPVFKKPKSLTNIVELSLPLTAGQKVTNVLAEDADIGDNGQVRYNISHGNVNSYFTIEPMTGFIYLSSSVLNPHNPNDNSNPQATFPSFKQHHILTITACDSGKPRLCSHFKNLRININKNSYRNKFNKGNKQYASNGNGNYDNNYGEDDSVSSSSSSTYYQQQEAIVICLVVLFVILLVVAGVLVCLIKCRSGSYNGMRGNGQNGPGSKICWLGRGPSNVRNGNNKDMYDGGANTHMIPSIDPSLKSKSIINESMRNEKAAWSQSQMDMGIRYGFVMDHTNPRLDYQTLESLCLATSPSYLMSHSDSQQQFIDPSNPMNLATTTRFHNNTQTLQQNGDYINPQQAPQQHDLTRTQPFYSNHDLKTIASTISPTLEHNDLTKNNNHSNTTRPVGIKDINIYQCIEDTQNNRTHFYNTVKPSSTMVTLNNSTTQQSDTNNNSNYIVTNPNDLSDTVNNNSNNNNNDNIENPKYSSYKINEASFV